MRLPLLAAVCVALAGPAAAQSLDIPSGSYNVDKTHASILWKVSHLGYSTYTGMFERSAIDATVELDAEDVANSTLSVTLTGTEVATLHPGEKDFNGEIASDMFLNAVEYPDITFESTGIEVTGDNTANITGDLTIRGTTLPLVLETTLNRAANHPMAGTPAFGITAIGEIDRTEFGVTSLAGPVGEMVSVEIQAEFMHAGE